MRKGRSLTHQQPSCYWCPSLAKLPQQQEPTFLNQQALFSSWPVCHLCPQLHLRLRESIGLKT